MDGSLFFKHLPYFAYILHRVIISAINSYNPDKILDKVIKLEFSCNISSNRVQRYDQFMHNKGKTPKLPLQVSTTRWYSYLLTYLLDAAMLCLDIHGNIAAYVEVEWDTTVFRRVS